MRRTCCGRRICGGGRRTRAARHFGEAELVNRTLAITTINAWNRIAIGFRVVAGTYQGRAAEA